MKLRYLFAFFFLAALSAFGQGSVGTGVPTVVNPLGQPLPGATVAVCLTDPGSPTTGGCPGHLATLYTDITIGTPCTGTSQPLSNPGGVGTGCSNPGKVDGSGNAVAFSAQGQYWCEYYGGGISGVKVVPCIFPVTASSGSFTFVNITATGIISAKNIEAIRYADQFTGADWCAKVQAAHDDLPSTGGTVDARALQGVQTACTSANITLSKPTSLIFGAGTYALGAKQLLTSANGISISGVAPTTTTISYTGSAAAIYGSLGGQTEIDYLSLSDFTLDGSGAGAGAIGVQEITPFGHRYTNIKVTGFTHNIKLDGSQNYGTLNVLDKVVSRSCITTALWLYGNADLLPIYSGRVMANTTITGGDFHCANGGTSIKLESAGIVYIASNLIENGNTGTGTGIILTGNSATSKSQDVKIIGNDFEGLLTGTNIDSNATRTSLIANDYFSVTTQLTDTGTGTTKMDLDATTADLYKFAKGLDLNFVGTSTGARLVSDLNVAEPRTCWYRPTGASTWYPFCIQNTNDVFQILRGDATATIGTIANYNAVFSVDNTGAITQANNAGVTQSTISNTGLATFNGGVKAGSSGSTITDSRELLQSAHSCGTTSTCANTANGSYREVFGSVALNSATPSATTVTGISPAFTSSATYFCTASPVGTTAAIAAGGVAVTNVSGSSFTVTGPNTVTTVVNYRCIGN